VADFDDLIRKYVDNLRQVVDTFRRGKVPAMEVGMTVEMITRLRHPEEPVDGF
jgi:hypothetical protein